MAEIRGLLLACQPVWQECCAAVAVVLSVEARSTRKGDFMNKNDVIAAVADKTGMSKAQAGQAVDSTFDVITDALKAGDEVKIIGFGNFSVAHRAASMGRNPRTGEAIQIAASKTPKFKAGKGLKDSVNR